MPDSDAQLETLIEKGKACFTSANAQHWQLAVDKLTNAGYGSNVVSSYVLHAPVVAEFVDEPAALALSSLVSLCAIKVNRVAAVLLPDMAAKACKLLVDKAGFQTWLQLITMLIEKAPEAVPPTLERTETVLQTLDIQQFKSWVYTGIRLTVDNPQAQKQYFSFRNTEAEKWLRREAGDVVFSDLQRKLKLFLISLWSLNAPVRVQKNRKSPLASRRITVSNGVITAPEIFPGFHGSQAKDLYFAGLAHVGAHLTFSHKKFSRGALKPIQIAVISLLEDARVEYLAMQAFPGLRKLWQPFHTAIPIRQNLVPVLLARLSRALIDPDYQDDNGWIVKARKLFFCEQQDLSDPAMVRRIGVLLGNDLGQLRAQFNAKTYVIEPPYRDDNAALWINDSCLDPHEDEENVEVEAVRRRTAQDNSIQPDNERNQRESADRQDNDKIALAKEALDTQSTIQAVIHYAEYDYQASTERPDWTRVVERMPNRGDPDKIRHMLDQHTELLSRITQLIHSAKVSTPTRLRRQRFGDVLDLDASIEAVISQRMGETPDARIYMRSERRQRDLSVLVLLDISYSTNDCVRASTTILDLELQATTLLAHALAALGDPFAIAAFCSDGRNDVHYYRLKDFDDCFDARVESNLAGIQGQLSTRLGAAMRHAAHLLNRQRSQRKLLLLVTDGEPSDIDVDDPRYLVEDARKAVWSIAHTGIDTFCVSLNARGENNLNRIFGRQNVTYIDNLQRLPERLPILYLRLTR